MTTISTPDLSDAAPEVGALELPWINYGEIRQFGGQVVTIKCHEDNSLVKACVEEAGLGGVVVAPGDYVYADNNGVIVSKRPLL